MKNTAQMIVLNDPTYRILFSCKQAQGLWFTYLIGNQSILRINVFGEIW